MSREYGNNRDLQQRILNGANVLADNVASTLGPRGRNVLLREIGKQPFITKDGVTVAHFVELSDPIEDAGAQIIKQAAIETNNKAGDGTTTSTVLARAILRESQPHLASGVSPIELQRGIDLATRAISSLLSESSTPVTTAEDIEHIATISANNDQTIGKLISLAVDRVGQDGSITIEESRSMDTTLDVTEGFRLAAGFCAGAFVTDERRNMMVHQDPLFLITDYKISTVEQILPVLEMVAREARPLIIVAEDIDGQALAALIMNSMRGSLKVAAIKAPEYGEDRRNTLNDLSISTGAVFVTRESGKKLTDVKMADLGTAKYIESTKRASTIVGGNCDFKAVEARIETLKNIIGTLDNLHECARIQERIVRLSSGVAVVRVGGATEVEMTEKKHRIEDALEAVRSAQEEGVVTGGGVALLRAAAKLIIETSNREQAIGVEIVKVACREPLRQMAMNAGESPDLVAAQVMASERNIGWDFRERKLTDLMERGIIDPVKVTRTALENAASCAGTLITTNYGIIQTG
tara:strand:+ start:10792 stop:12363 length:1572 start_codon:yes stop_codon:yes gene_type:complete